MARPARRRHAIYYVPLAVLLLATAACGSAQPFGADIERIAGCDDAVIFGESIASSSAVVVVLDAPVSRAHDEGHFIEHVELPHESVRVELLFGSGVTIGLCSDETDPLGEPRAQATPDIAARWAAVSGTIEIQVQPVGVGDERPLGRASVTLRDVVFEETTGIGDRQRVAERLSLRDVPIGQPEAREPR